MENSFPISFSKCAARIHLIGQLSDQSNFTCFYSPKCPLSNGENRSSLSCSVRQLFKKHQSLLYFENDISCWWLSVYDMLSEWRKQFYFTQANWEKRKLLQWLYKLWLGKSNGFPIRSRLYSNWTKSCERKTKPGISMFGFTNNWRYVSLINESQNNMINVF